MKGRPEIDGSYFAIMGQITGKIDSHMSYNQILTHIDEPQDEIDRVLDIMVDDGILNERLTGDRGTIFDFTAAP